MLLFLKYPLLTLVTINFVINVKINEAILVGESPTGSNSNNNSENTQQTSLNSSDNNKIVLNNNEQQDLTNNTKFYYEANEFVDNNKTKKSSSISENKNNESPPVGPSMTSARNGRMMDLDALVGDFATSQQNKEKRLTGDRQSRFLSQNMELGNGKRLHIQGFIPIVGVKDVSGEENDNENQDDTSISMKQHKQRAVNQAQAQINELPYAQSSIGHATFGVQRYLNSEQPAQQFNVNFDKASGSSATGIIETLKKPIKKITGLTSTTQDTQQQNCLCVPFYMCKNGYISESSLGKAQIQQMISQQQQQQQLPNQYLSNQQQIEMKSGHSVPLSLQQQQQQFQQQQMMMMMKQAINQPQQHTSSFESYPLIDERSFDREIITMAPLLSNSASDQSNNQTVDFNSSPSLSEQQQQQSFDNQTLNNNAGEESNSAYANSSSVAEGALGSTDYSQEILGRMLGLKSNKANSRQQQSMIGGSSSSSGQSTGVCGLLRTCCNIPLNNQLFPSQQDVANERLMLVQQQPQQFVNTVADTYKQQAQLMSSQVSLPNNVQTIYGSTNPFDQKATSMMVQPQNQLQKYNNQVVNKQQLPYGFPSNQRLIQQNYASSSNIQPAFVSQISSSASDFSPPLAHRTSQLNTNNKYQTNIQQFTRAAGQPLQSFQQQQAQLYQQPKALSNQLNLRQINNNNLLGTRKILEGRCGLRQSAGINGRVQNLQYHESSADFGEYPAQAAILKRLSGSDSLFVCGGTLISQYWVATAAHCIKKHSQNDLKVRLGEWDVHRDDEFYPYVEKEVRDLIIHPEFVAGNLMNDIALIRLDSPVDPSLPHINPACLPTLDETFTRQQCWVTGWGKDSFGQKGSFQAVLKEVELPVVGQAECEQALRSTRLGQHYRLHSGFLCAGGEGGKDACEGDGGSGLYCVQDGVIKVAGLVSWGIGCGQAGVPGVYVNLAHYRPWIENIISIDEDIYSPMTNLLSGTNSLISERSNSDIIANQTTLFNNNNDTGTRKNSSETIITQ